MNKIDLLFQEFKQYKKRDTRNNFINNELKLIDQFADFCLQMRVDSYMAYELSKLVVKMWPKDYEKYPKQFHPKKKNYNEISLETAGKLILFSYGSNQTIDTIYKIENVLLYIRDSQNNSKLVYPIIEINQIPEFLNEYNNRIEKNTDEKIWKAFSIFLYTYYFVTFCYTFAKPTMISSYC